MMAEFNNIVIEAIHKDHAKDIINFFNELGIDTRPYIGDNTLEYSMPYRYYGIIDNKFDCYPLELVNSANALIIPTGNFEIREMYVWQNNYPGKDKRKVIGKYKDKYITQSIIPMADASEKLVLYDNAEEIPQKIKITRAEFEAKYQIID